MSLKALLVPISLEAVCIGARNSREEALSLAGASADFTNLPYRYQVGNQVISRTVANISRNVLAAPFETTDAPLEQGIHLHWALPAALATGRLNPESGQVEFPAVPNRWLVTRTVTVTVDQQAQEQPQHTKSWLVESDHLSDINDGVSLAFPVESDTRPFKFLGRVYEIKAGEVPPLPSAYLDKLTALGFGQLSFAAYYPNCRNVFGMHDSLAEITGSCNVSYQVTGFYSKPEDDFLFRAMAEAGQDTRVIDILTSYGWQLFPPPEATEKEKEEAIRLLPETNRLLCSGLLNEIKWDSQRDYFEDFSDALKAGVAIGNTPGEALAALLANSPALTNDIHAETLLHALQLDALTNLDLPDSIAKMEEALHQSAFRMVDGGSVWHLHRQGAVQTDAAQVNLDQSLQGWAGSRLDSLSPDLRDDFKAIEATLANLNRWQVEVDQLQFQIDSWRSQIFADWQQYMIYEYEWVDARVNQVRHHLETTIAQELNPLLAAHSQALGQRDQQLTEIKTLIANFNAAYRDFLQKNPNTQLTEKAEVGYTLQPVAAPRYYQANEPVILLSGQDVPLPTRYGKSSRLLNSEGQLVGADVTLEGDDQTLLETIRANETQLKTQLKGILDTRFEPVTTWRADTWQPHFMEWEIQVYPLQKINHRHGWPGDYEPAYLTANYDLDQDRIELTYTDLTPQQPQTFMGTTILSPDVALDLKTQLRKLLALPESQLQKMLPDADSQNILELVKGIENMSLLAQAVSGFNQGLLMRQQTLQLKVSDPLADNHFLRKFSNETVAAAVGAMNDSAPLPNNSFSPIRTGLMEVAKIYVIDTFGRSKKLLNPPLIPAEHLMPPLPDGAADQVYLPPRLTQPSRLSFRWLDAIKAEQEMATISAATPICGWVLPNYLDGSLLLYDRQGQVLGTFRLSSAGDDLVKDSPPGYSEAPDIRNPHLAKFSQKLDSEGGAFLKEFLRVTDIALANIEPHNFRQNQSIVIYMGRPLALVRASLKLELKGLPAVNQSEDALLEIARGKVERRDTNNFEQVRFPIRLGDMSQLNDGLVGYFIEQNDAPYQTFYSAAADPGDGGDPHIVRPASGQVTLACSPEGEAVIVAMLVDPRASVHATTGILPVKEINIPPDQYVDALQAIQVTFLTNPILSGPARLALPLAEEAGYQWSWFSKDSTGWQETGEIGPVTDRAMASYSPQYVGEGWLKLSKVEDKVADAR